VGGSSNRRIDPLRVLPCADASVNSNYFAAIEMEADVDLLPIALVSTLVFRAQTDQPDAIVIATEDFATTGWRRNASLRATFSATPTVLLAGDVNAALRTQAARLHIRSVLPLEITTDQLLAAINATVAGLAVTLELSSLTEGEQDDAWFTEESLLEHLTTRETVVLRLMALGYGNKEIAGRLDISEHTAKFHVSSVLAKLGATSRTEAVTLGIMRGLVAI
jgi:DNA-binding NarL/FixJ family response regulator